MISIAPHAKYRKLLFLPTGNFPIKPDSVWLLGLEYSINPQNLMKIVSPFYDNRNFNFFLKCTALNFKGWSKTEKTTSKYLQENSRYSVSTRLVSCFRRYVGQCSHRKLKKKYFSSFKDFSGEISSVTLFSFECTINPQNLIKIAWAIFEKIKISIFFVMWTILNFKGRSKAKVWPRNIYKMTLYVEFE